MPPTEEQHRGNIDRVHVPLLHVGVYRLRFNNPRAWFRSSNVHYKIVFMDASGNAATAAQLTTNNFSL